MVWKIKYLRFLDFTLDIFMVFLFNYGSLSRLFPQFLFYLLVSGRRALRNEMTNETTIKIG